MMKRKWLILNIANAILLFIVLYASNRLRARGAEIVGATFLVLKGLPFRIASVVLRGAWFVLDSRLRTRITPFQESAVKGASLLVLAVPWIIIYCFPQLAMGDLGIFYPTGGEPLEPILAVYLLIQCLWSLAAGILRKKRSARTGE